MEESKSQRRMQVQRLPAQLAHDGGCQLHLKGLSEQLALESEERSNQALPSKAVQHLMLHLRPLPQDLHEVTAKS